jgi:hypothetical protein
MVSTNGFRSGAAAVVVIAAVIAGNGSSTVGARSARQAGSDARVQTAAQITRNDHADVTFELRPAAAGGGIAVVARSADLQVTKTVQPGGDFVIELAAGQDKVTIAGSGQGATVTRGRATIALRRTDSSEEPMARVRRLLAESNAVVRFRAVAARLIEDDDRTHEALALILADATVGMLTGDAAAPRRIARALAERRNRHARPVGMAVDCYTVMETRMMEAWNDYGSCYYSTAYNSFYQYLCSWRWTIQVESDWFNFLGCTGFNFS